MDEKKYEAIMEKKSQVESQTFFWVKSSEGTEWKGARSSELGGMVTSFP